MLVEVARFIMVAEPVYLSLRCRRLKPADALALHPGIGNLSANLLAEIASYIEHKDFIGQIDFEKMEEVQRDFIDPAEGQVCIRFGIAPDTQDNAPCQRFTKIGFTKCLRKATGAA